MSASREKKQRQGAGLDPKQTQAQKEQAERKRKTVLYTVIGVVAAVLVAALLIWRSGFFQSRVTAATVGDQKLTTAELCYYYYNVRSSNFAYYSYLGSTPPADTEVMDEESGQTYREYFLETGLDNAQEIIALYEAAVAEGYSDSDVKDDLKAAVDYYKSQAAASGLSYSAYLKAMFSNYMSAGTFEKLLTRELVASKYYSDRGAKLSADYSQDELDAYYEENGDSLDTFEYSYLYVAAEEVEDTDEDGNELDEDAKAELEEQAMADAKAKAEEVQGKLEDGGEVADLATEYEISSYADHTVSVGSNISTSAVYHDDLMGMKDGDIKSVEATGGYYVVTLHSRTLDETPTANVRHILARAESTTDDDGNNVAPTEEAWAAAQKKIEEIQAEYKAGEQTEDAFAALADKYSDDGDGTTGGLYEKVASTDNYVPEFLDWIFADGRQTGDVSDPIRHEGTAGTTSSEYWGYHLIYYVSDDEPVWMRSARSALATDELTAWSEELSSAYPTALAGGADYLGA